MVADFNDHGTIDGVAEVLAPAQQDRLEAAIAAFYGPLGDTHDPLQQAKDAKLKEILYRDLLVFREAGLRLDEFYVRLLDGRGVLTACSATKVERWRNDGYTPVEELE